MVKFLVKNGYISWLKMVIFLVNNIFSNYIFGQNILIIAVGVLFLKVLNFTENDLIFENGVSNVDFGQVCKKVYCLILY